MMAIDFVLGSKFFDPRVPSAICERLLLPENCDRDTSILTYAVPNQRPQFPVLLLGRVRHCNNTYLNHG